MLRARARRGAGPRPRGAAARGARRGEPSRGRWRHFHAPLYVFHGESLRERTGRRTNDENHPRPGDPAEREALVHNMVAAEAAAVMVGTHEYTHTNPETGLEETAERKGAHSPRP